MELIVFLRVYCCWNNKGRIRRKRRDRYRWSSFISLKLKKNLSFPLLLLFIYFFLSSSFAGRCWIITSFFERSNSKQLRKLAIAPLLGNALRNRCRPRYTPAYDDYKGDYGSVAGFSFSNGFGENRHENPPLSAFEFIADGFERARDFTPWLNWDLWSIRSLGRRSDSKGFRKGLGRWRRV